MTDSRTMGLIDALEQGAKLTREEWRHVLTKRNKEIADVVFQKASAVRDHVYGKKIYIRGLIEFRITVKMTAITAESEGVQGRPATGFPRRRF